MKKYIADIRDRYAWLEAKGYDFTDKKFSFEEKHIPNVSFNKIEEGMHMFICSTITDLNSDYRLPLGLYEIVITHKYADYIFFSLTEHPEISEQAASKHSVAFETSFYPYEVIVPKQVNLEFLNQFDENKIKINHE